MDTYRDGPGALFDCASCAGQFVEHAMFREMLHRHTSLAVDDAAIRLPRRPDPRSTYIPCPECSVLMNRKNFGITSGVVVDVCKKHGTWFDEGELPRVLAFVTSGGLERAKKREAEEAARLRHDAAVSSRTPVMTSSSSGERWEPQHETRADVVVDFFLHLLD
jgi:Zn-finger nucleic acid-binding protein